MAVVTANTFHARPIPPSVASRSAITGEAMAWPMYTAIINVADIWPNSFGPKAAGEKETAGKGDGEMRVYSGGGRRVAAGAGQRRPARGGKRLQSAKKRRRAPKILLSPPVFPYHK